MRILVIGATGTIGKEIVKALSSGNDIVAVSHSHTPIKVDIADGASIRAMYKQVGKVDAVVSAAGNAVRKPLAELSDEDFDFSLKNKLMGQVNVVRYGLEHVNDGGSFTLTGGILARSPIPGSGTLSLVNCGLEGFARAAALDLESRRIRVNVVSPPWVNETLDALGMKGIPGLSSAAVAQSYAGVVNGKQNGQVVEPAPKERT